MQQWLTNMENKKEEMEGRWIEQLAVQVGDPLWVEKTQSQLTEPKQCGHGSWKEHHHFYLASIYCWHDRGGVLGGEKHEEAGDECKG